MLLLRHYRREATPDARFGARALFAGLALLLPSRCRSGCCCSSSRTSGPRSGIDDGARDGLHAFAVTHRTFVQAMATLSAVGRSWVYLPVFAVVAGWLLWRRQTRLAVFVAVTVGVSPGINGLVKSAVHRARPVLTDPVAHASGASFPSGHAQAAVVGYSVLLLVFLPVLHGALRRVAIAAAR